MKTNDIQETPYFNRYSIKEENEWHVAKLIRVDKATELKSLVKEIEVIEDWKSIHALDTHETSEEEWGEKHNRLNKCQSRMFEIIKSL